MTQEFHISVTPVGQNDYLVRTEQVAPGVPLAEELVTWPVAEWLAAAGHLMNDPLMSVFQGNDASLVDDSRLSEVNARNSFNLAALGQQLYNELFQGTLRDSWITAQGIAENHQQVLRLRLGMKDTRLARLPWEVMHTGDSPIAAGPYIVFSRYQSGMNGSSRLPSTNMPIPQEEGVIKVLMVVASPSDQVRLDLLTQEAIKLQAELSRHSLQNFEDPYLQQPEIQLTALQQPGREELTQALEQGRYHILHYSGHSNLGKNGGEIYLVNRRNGLTETLTGDDLAGLLVNNNIQMVVLNSCLGAYGATNDSDGETGERSLTESLVKRGIRSVLAMSERIPDDVALTLTQLFYRNLSQGYPLDLCVSRMRQGLITSYGAHQTYWALPILYLQSDFDGNLSPSIYLPPIELLDEFDASLQGGQPAYSPQLSLPMQGTESTPLLGDTSDLDWLGEGTWGDLMDDIVEYDDPHYEDASYAEDSAIVSDLFRQLDNQRPAESQNQEIAAEVFTETNREEESIPGIEVSEDLTSVNRQVEIWREQRAVRENSSQKQVSPGNQVTSQRAELATVGTYEDKEESSSVAKTVGKSIVSKSYKRYLLPVIGIIGVGAVSLIGLNWWQSQQSLLPDIQQFSASQPGITTTPNLKEDKTEIITAYAAEKLSQGEIEVGLKAVEELLNRNVLPSVEAALSVVPKEQADNPLVNFYKGRLAWQSVQIGDKKYSIDDARRYWETAIKVEPNSSTYLNAVGFAFYAEGNLDKANDSWFKALDIALKEQKRVAQPVANAAKPMPREAVTAYAGLALGLYKSAYEKQPPGSKRQQYIEESVKLRKIVVSDDPESFQINKLAQNWLWTEKALADWQELLKVSNQRR
ncbi:cell division protein HetF [Calothrix sp. PCC 6303]|uniref:cell division protein HetF n=1 Tax=Calothrix sp. PCC 6303 TaxID=1170562 RepID=UPI0002A0381B|nr:cell division protein HetF [Calothrix sp. PCC 6303]AFZ00469.1 heterocyst differentiation protein HetF [Calothrix sp. PCC 6303]